MVTVFFTVYVFDRRKMETKSCLIAVFHRIYRCYIYSYPDSDGYNRIYKEKELNSILGTILEFLCILGLTYYIKKHDKIAEWLKKLPTSYYFVGFLCSFMATGASTYVEMDLENKSYNERIMISILMMVTVELLYIMCIGAAVIATFCKNYKEESLLKWSI